MKRFAKMGRVSSIAAVAAATATFAAAGCAWLPENTEDENIVRDAVLKINFVETKADVIDKNNFTLSVVSAAGDTCWFGRFADRPAELQVASGEYIVRALSDLTPMPVFDLPVYGGEARAVVRSGEKTDVALICRMVNSGLKLSFTETFKNRFSNRTPVVMSASGELAYPYSSEGATAYFDCGKVYFTLDREVMLSRDLAAGEIRHLTLDASDINGKASVSISLDETQTPVEDSHLIENTLTMNVVQAKSLPHDAIVTVRGTIVGCISSSKFVREGKVATNVVLADNGSDEDLELILPVELKTTAQKEALGLTTNDLIGRMLTVKGTVGKLYGTSSLVNISSWNLEQ